ncbi:hypothetical protein H6P81_016936 [Aristolochia fimbriata]|uniref:Short-chain dehydrogenase/reductase n=1 Tax=Aristolochia fimbriata TaxID=158543 RepID=A0AAV7DWZ4_ARIFI|nr:hypothetical protein H6P81_016936 [Aristolochia fimbriata]
MAEGASSNSTGRRSAVVSGGNKGIGLAICRQLASNGVVVILTARDEKRGREAVSDLTESGIREVVFHQLDVTDSASISSLAEFVRTRFGKLDILVNNAGVSGLTIDHSALEAPQLPQGELLDDKPDLLRRILGQNYEKVEACIQTNYYGSKAVTEALLPLLQLSKSPRIVNVSSIYGQLKFIPGEKIREELNNLDGLSELKIDELLQQFLKDFKEDLLDAQGWPNEVSAYKVSKAALNAYTRLLAKKFPKMCINCVHPGLVKTDMNFISGILTPDEGARGPVMLALLPDGGPSGLHFDQMEVSTF